MLVGVRHESQGKCLVICNALSQHRCVHSESQGCKFMDGIHAMYHKQLFNLFTLRRLHSHLNLVDKSELKVNRDYNHVHKCCVAAAIGALVGLIMKEE